MFDEQRARRARHVQVARRAVVRVRRTRTIRPAQDRQEIVKKFGHEAVMWTDNDRTYVILARARPADLGPVVGYVRANAR